MKCISKLMCNWPWTRNAQQLLRRNDDFDAFCDLNVCKGETEQEI